MRIIIEIDGTESTTIKIQPTTASATLSGATDESVAVSRSTPPPEILAAAAALGASNAGPAPVEGTLLTTVGLDPKLAGRILGEVIDAGHASADAIAPSGSMNAILAADNGAIEINDAGAAPRIGRDRGTS